jgi:hypothetical protein
VSEGIANMSESNVTAETIDLIKGVQATPDELIKSFISPSTAVTGLQAYNLEGPSKKLFPVLTPLRNMIGRVTGGFAIQANWKAITNINVGNVRAGVSEGRRGGVITHTQSEYLAAFRGFGLENNVTFEAGYAAKNYEDVKAVAASTTLQATMIQEERLILGGNTSLALGVTPTPTTTTATTGGTVAAATQSVICVALGLQAYLDVSGVNNGSIGQSADLVNGVPGVISRPNADGTTETFGGGSAQKSAASAQVTTGATSTITATVAPVRGAVGYAWYLGVAGSERLAAVTSIASVVLTAPAGGSNQLASALAASDNSTSSLDFDGLLTMAFNPALNAYYLQMPAGTSGIGTGLTADGAGGISEFEAAFVSFYNKYRLSPTRIFVSSQELINITKKIIANGGAPLLRMNFDAANPGTIRAGTVVGAYLNKVTGTEIPLVVHPNLPAGTVFFYTETLPYDASGIGMTARMLMRQDYYQLEWPLKSRKYEYGVYADGVLQHYAPFSMGIITGIGNA